MRVPFAPLTLLAGNLVRNEAQEILDAARKPSSSSPGTDTASSTTPNATPTPGDQTANPDGSAANAPGATDAKAGDPNGPRGARRERIGGKET